jgi:hypothetical protein
LVTRLSFGLAAAVLATLTCFLGAAAFVFLVIGAVSDTSFTAASFFSGVDALLATLAFFFFLVVFLRCKRPTFAPRTVKAQSRIIERSNHRLSLQL